MVISTFRLFPSRDERRHLLSILRSVQGPIQSYPHCKSCRIYEEDGVDNAVLFLERWDSEADFERHVKSELYRRILNAVEFSRSPPEIFFNYVSKTRGIDLIEDLRKHLEPQG
ncbi:MAG: antibiotic biosynthesis monooxygenase [Verrucomicrobia bacterium]|nr:MAG: antibiotic biosynthesis monooxygenase [Verrucomicrobiota bacterium]